MSDFFDKVKKGKEKIKKFGEEQKKARQLTPLPIMMLNDALPLLVIVTYILLGSLKDLWHPAWLIFFIIPIYYMSMEALVHKSPELVPIVFIVIATYLALGCIGARQGQNYWHPYWALFLAIPVYYMMIAAIKGANWSKIFDILVPFLVVGVYLVLGFTVKPGGWHPGWVIFFAIPLYYIWKGSVYKYQKIRKEIESEDGDAEYVKVKIKDGDEDPDDQRKI